MRESLNRNRTEVLLALAVAVALYFGGQGLLAMWEARTTYEDARGTQRELETEAARYNLAALTADRDRLEAEASLSVFPPHAGVESDVGTIAGLVADPSIALGPVVMGEIADEVTDADVGLAGEGARTYDGIEMLLTVNGEVFNLLNLAERLLAAVPDATFRDVTLTLAEAPSEPSSLSLRVLLYYDE